MTSSIDELERLTALVDGFVEDSGLPAMAGFDLNLILEELVPNVSNHGYGNEGRGEILARLGAGAHQVFIQVEDQASEFNPIDEPPTTMDQSIEDRPIGGLGAHLVKNLADDIDYRRENGRNILTIRKKY